MPKPYEEGGCKRRGIKKKRNKLSMRQVRGFKFVRKSADDVIREL